MMDLPIKKCPECQGEVRRLISGGVGFAIRGPRQDGIQERPSKCSIETTGRTCCGRETRCEERSCERGA